VGASQQGGEVSLLEGAVASQQGVEASEREDSEDWEGNLLEGAVASHESAEDTEEA